MQFEIVDVFAEQKYQGNQLAVVRDAAGLDAATMQAIAREMNFSETTFVTAATAKSATVRIFTPVEELPFAGHPTLGTAWVLGRQQETFTLRLPIGEVQVSFDTNLVWMTPPHGQDVAAMEPAVAAELIGLPTSELDPTMELRVLQCGPEYYLIGVRSLAALRSVRIELAVLQRHGLNGFPFVVCRGGYSKDVDFAARMHFFDGTGMREDPATGSANAAFAYYLKARGEAGDLIVEQGFEVGRPSRIYLRIGRSREDQTVRVGGQVQPVATGQLL